MNLLFLKKAWLSSTIHWAEHLDVTWPPQWRNLPNDMFNRYNYVSAWRWRRWIREDSSESYLSSDKGESAENSPVHIRSDVTFHLAVAWLEPKANIKTTMDMYMACKVRIQCSLCRRIPSARAHLIHINGCSSYLYFSWRGLDCEMIVVRLWELRIKESHRACNFQNRWLKGTRFRISSSKQFWFSLISRAQKSANGFAGSSITTDSITNSYFFKY